MIEKLYSFTQSHDRLVEKVLEDDYAAINHMVLPQGESLPEHYSNSNVYLIVVHGAISLVINDSDEVIYPMGSIISIPYQTKMRITNPIETPLEFFVIKAPSPKTMAKNA
jgi:quercetin dioxygenase-like cupin family protein